MPQPRRDTTAMNQERISRHQVILCFEQVGWTAAEPPDLGEDLIISVYLNGVASGVTFFTQVKSVTDLHRRSRQDYLPYKFKTKDLEHWQAFALPVILIVWDINLQEGRWIFTNDAILTLDRVSPDWHAKKSAIVHLPLSHGTNKEGLDLLKFSIGTHLYSIISKGRDLNVHLVVQFDNTPEDQSRLEAFEHFVNEGEQVELVGHTIKELSFSDWWQPWMVTANPAEMRLVIGPHELRQKLYASIELISLQGLTASIPFIELISTKVGLEAATFSTVSDNTPIDLKLMINKITNSITMTLAIFKHNPGKDMNETLRLTTFCQAASAGGQMLLTLLGVPGEPLVTYIPPNSGWALDPEYIRLVHLLWNIQHKTGTILQVPAKGISRADVQSMEELTMIIDNGKTITQAASGTLNAIFNDIKKVLPALLPGADIYLEESFQESYVELFGIHLQTGPMIRKVKGKLATSPAEIQAFSTINPGESIPLKLKDLEITDMYINWQSLNKIVQASIC